MLPWEAMRCLKDRVGKVNPEKDDIFIRMAEFCCTDYACALELVCRVPEVPERIRRKAMVKCCETATWAYDLRCAAERLPEDIKLMAELKVCENPTLSAALRIRADCELNEDVKRRLEKSAARNGESAFKLLVSDITLAPENQLAIELKVFESNWLLKLVAKNYRNKLSETARTIAELVQLGMPVEEAKKIVIGE